MALSPQDRDMIVRTALGEAGDDGNHAAVVRDILGRDGAPSDVVLSRGNYKSWNSSARDLLRIDPESARYKKVAQVVDRVVSDAPGADILSQYGVKAPGTTASPAAAAPSTDASVILKNYGVKLPAPKAATPDDRTADIAGAKPGKVPEVQEPPVVPTAREKAAATTRGATGQFLSSVPIAGPAVNALNAAIMARGGDPNAPWWDRFTNEVNTLNRADKYYAQEHPFAAAGAQLAGGLSGYGALGMTGTGRALMGMAPNLPWATRVYLGAGGGASINTIDAAMRGENPIPAAEIGAAGGVFGPTLSEGARAGTGWAANYLYPRPGALGNVPRPGINLLTNALEGETPQSLRQAQRNFGPAGFFGDLTPGLTDVTGGMSDMHIPQRAMLQEAYRQRAAQQGARIERAVTHATGVPENFDVVQYERFLTDARARAADPLYEQWRTMQVHPTPTLQSLVPRLEKAGAFNMAEELSGISGRPIDRNFFVAGPRKNFPTTEAWDYVKRGLDRRIDQAYTSGDKTLARELIGLRGQLIDEIEKTPAGQVWRQARREFADRSALIDQVAAGRDTFLGGRAGLTPDELREELSHLSRPELVARVQGMRAAIRDSMGDRTEGAGAIRAKLLAPNNQAKMRMMIGNGPAEDLIATLESERRIAEKLPAIVPNMNTGASGATRAERRNLFNPPQLPEWRINLAEPGSLLPPSLRPHNVLQSIINDRYARTAPALAPLMLRQGRQSDELINALMAERDRLARVNRVSGPYINALSGVVAGPGQATYGRRIESQQP